MTGNTDELRGFRKLYEFSQLLLTGNDPEDLLARLVEATRTITKADEVLLFEIEGGVPVIRAVAIDGPGEQEDRQPEYSRTLVNEVIERGEPLLLRDVCEDPRFEAAKSIQMLSITSAMGSPLFHDGKLKGIIYAARQRMMKNFTEEHRELMTVAASQASLLFSRLASVQALRESESRHRSLVEMSPSTIAVVQDRKLVFASRAATALWGCDDVDELLGQEMGDLFDPWRSQLLFEAFRQMSEFESVDGWAWRKQGAEPGVPVEVVGRPIQFDGKDAIQLMISEVGEKKALLARRVRTDRLVVMGTIAATVSHEINNPLSYVYANLDYVVEELECWWEKDSTTEILDDETRRDLMAGLHSAREGTERIRGVVESIQNFSCLEDEEEEVTEVRRPLESSIRIAKNKLGPDVDLQIDIRPTAPVPVCAARLGQVFLNLLINAAQALTEMPTDFKRTKRVEVRCRQEYDDEVIIEIVDNGPGISPEVRRHIFEPFVSTKPSDTGTGLGLAICNDIIKAGGGRIEVESSAGEGSLFRIYLPAVAEPATESIEMIPDSEGGLCGRILVVDPEPTLGRSLQRVLQGQHDVTAVSSKREAVQLLMGAMSYDVILCDLRLRGGVGFDLFRWVEKNAPEYWDKLVAMTASGATQRTREYLDALPNPWVAKPFEIRRLRAIIDGLLGEVEDKATSA